MIHKKIKIKQHDISDCGVACIASILQYYGYSIPISRIRIFASTNKKGTNALGLIEAAEKFGFKAKGVKGEFNSIFHLPKPCIAHFIIKNKYHHYVVVYKANKKYIKIMDPADGCLYNLSHDEFRSSWSNILILLFPTKASKPTKQTTTIQRFWNLVRPFNITYSQILFCSIVYSLLSISSAIYIQKIIDIVLTELNYKFLNILSIFFIISFIFQVFIYFQKNILAIRIGQSIDSSLILNYYKHVLELPQHFFDTMRIGEIISRINDAVKIRSFINNTAIELLLNILIVIFSFLIMVIYSTKLTIIFLIIFPLYVLIFLITNRINKTYQRKIMVASANFESQLVESITTISTIRSLNLEWFTNVKTEVGLIKLLKPLYVSGKNYTFSQSSSIFLSKLSSLLILWVGAILAINGKLSAGKLISFYAIIGYLTPSINNLLNCNILIHDALIASDRLYEIMDLETVRSTNNIHITEEMLGDIVYQNVTFSYKCKVPLYKDLNLTIPHNKITAIVGESGSGKSTLIALLQKFYQLTNGQIYIGDYNINHISNASLRKITGIIPQKIELFSGSILENIILDDLNPNMSVVFNLCKTLGMFDFINKLPDSFDTYIGENGLTISGGEKQKIAIARVLYKNPKILIFDEAVSSLDSLSEEYIQKLIKVLKNQDKTIIIITHNLNSITKADKIIVFRNGIVVEQGNHLELISNGSLYYQLWQKKI